MKNVISLIASGEKIKMEMRMNNNSIATIKKTLLILMCLCLFNGSFGKSLKHGQSGGHEADIYSVLPFGRNDKIDALILAIHNNIDLPVGYFNGLRDEPHHHFT